MKYIPGYEFEVSKKQLFGTIKKYFKSGSFYKLWGIRVKDKLTGEVVYIFWDKNKSRKDLFEIPF